MDEGAGREAHHSARHPRDSPRKMLATDDVCESRMADGGRYHGIVAETRSGGSGQIRLLVVSPRHGGRMRLQPRAGGLAVSVERFVSATPAWCPPACIR